MSNAQTPIETMVGRKITITKGREKFTGVLKSLGKAIAIDPSGSSASRLWLLEGETYDLEFHANDGWSISALD